MQGASGGGIVEQQHTSHDVVRLHGTRDGAVRNEVFRGALQVMEWNGQNVKWVRSHFIANYGILY